MTISDYFDSAMLNKYNTAGPRYTSYPTAVSFECDYSESDFTGSIKDIAQSAESKSLSLYLHIPFCHSLCYYCGCNKIVTRNKDKIDTYLKYLKKEISHRSKQFKGFTVDTIHFGGGTPSFLEPEQLFHLMVFIEQQFKVDSACEKSIEIDPRELPANYLNDLYVMGFTRISIGVQDVNKDVQEKINRVQSTQFIKSIIKQAKTLGFRSVNIDLIYGLPGQSQTTLLDTLQEVKHMDPDRISLFSYAHMPQLFAAQRKIKDEWLPKANEKFALFQTAINELVAQGYVYIGMDHFAKPNDKLSVAAENKTLARNFQGYTTDQASTLLGLGVSSISNLGNSYAQNFKKLSDYYTAIDKETSAIEKGVVLNSDDIIHRALIHQLMCNFFVDKAQFSEKYKVDFDDYFAKSLFQLGPYIDDNLISNNVGNLTIHPRGRLLVRNICMNFDQYIQEPMHQVRYSRVI